MQSERLFTELREASPLISVGLLAANMMSLGSELELLEKAGVRLLHFDVMDGCFCPSMTVGPVFIKAVKTSLLKDVHLMIDSPLDKLSSFVATGADIVTINIESCKHIHRALQVVGEMQNINDQSRGILRGVSLNPATPLDVIRPLIDEVEMVLLLAVNPGFVGQKFITSIQQKVARLRQMTCEVNKDVLICIDGGIKRTNVAEVAKMGADVIVTGSAVFDGKRPLENVAFMQRALQQARTRNKEETDRCQRPK